MEFEKEIKIKVDDLKEVERKLISSGAILKKDCWEKNYLFDNKESLYKRGEALRLRECGRKITLTFKGKRITSPKYKIREEIEVEINSFEAMREILLRLGFEVAFYYEKKRKNYLLNGVLISLDITPLGNFIEIEGDEQEIDEIAAFLGFSPENYIRESYVEMALSRGLKSLRF